MLKDLKMTEKGRRDSIIFVRVCCVGMIYFMCICVRYIMLIQELSSYDIYGISLLLQYNILYSNTTIFTYYIRPSLRSDLYSCYANTVKFGGFLCINMKKYPVFRGFCSTPTCGCDRDGRIQLLCSIEYEILINIIII